MLSQDKRNAEMRCKTRTRLTLLLERHFHFEARKNCEGDAVTLTSSAAANEWGNENESLDSCAPKSRNRTTAEKVEREHEEHR